MNNENNKIGQINHVVTPIKVDNNGVPIKQTVVTQPVVTEPVKQEVKKEVKEHDSSTMIFVVVLLIILALVVGFLFYYIIPRYLDSKKTIEYNDKLTTQAATSQNISNIGEITLSNTIFTNLNMERKISDKFTLRTENINGVLNVYVNGILVTTTNNIYESAAAVDDTLIIAVKNKTNRTTKLLFIDANSKITKEYFNIGESEGFALMNNESSIIFGAKSILLVTTRINNNRLILNNDIGSTEGINICNDAELEAKGITRDFPVVTNFQINYLGNNMFSKPIRVSSTKLSDYININHLCN